MGGWLSGLRRWSKLVDLQWRGVDSRWDHDIFLCQFSKKLQLMNCKNYYFQNVINASLLLIIFAIIRLQKLELSEYKSCMLKVGRNCNYQTANFRTLRLQTMHVKNAKKASSKLQRMQTTLSRNYCSINAPKLSAVIHCLQWMTAKIALKLQWEIEHSGNLQNLQGNYLQCGNFG